jgi:putative DNA primase/helicase
MRALSLSNTYIDLAAKGDNDFGATLAKIEAKFVHNDTQAARAASRFALYAMSGELAIEAGILPWLPGAALSACLQMFDAWQTLRGGSGATETGQILQSVADYLLKHGDTKFTGKDSDEAPRLERAGWYTLSGDERVYLLTPAALIEAGGNFDKKRILDALDGAGWIVERDSGKKSKVTAIRGKSSQRLYWIVPADDGSYA